MGSSVFDQLEDLLSWKRTYGSIYYIKIGESYYVFRTLTRGEHSTLMKVGEELECDTGDLIVRTCLLYPVTDISELDKLLAGEFDYLLRSIVSMSGFSQMERVEKDIEEARESIATLENQIIILVCKAFPHLTIQDVDRFTYDELIKYLAVSEAILDMKLTIEKKPDTKPGVIDFDEENRAVGGAAPIQNNPQKKPRGVPRAK